MLIQITNKCSESCRHCLTDSSPEGRHMTMDTFDQMIAFYKKIPVTSIKWLTDIEYPTLPTKFIISGGEPTEHPLLGEFMIRLTDKIPTAQIIIESNGMWLGDPKKEEMVALILDLEQVKLMITAAHSKYSSHYNKYMLQKEKLIEFGFNLKSSINVITEEMVNGEVEKTPEKSKLIADADWLQPEGVICLGRASSMKQKKITTQSVYPACYRVMMQAQEAKSYGETIVKDELFGGYVHPYISVDGNIHLGVCDECIFCGNVATTSPDEVYAAIRSSYPCEKCGLEKNISEVDRLAYEQKQKYGAIVQ